jgi:integrase
MANTIYVRLKIEGKGWRFMSVPVGAGKPPLWKKEAETAALNGGRGFQYRLSDGNWSDQFPTIAKAQDAAKNAPAVAVAEARGLSVEDASANSYRLTLRSAVDSFINRKTGKKADSTVEKYTHILNQFLEMMPRTIRFVDQVDGNVLDAFMKGLQNAGAAPKTVNDKVLIVCFMLKAAGIETPSKMIELLNVEEQPVEPYKETDLKTLFADMTPEEQVRYRFFLDTACREQEVACAQWVDIDWQKSEYHVRSKSWKAANGLTKSFTTKNHKARHVPLTRELADMLRKRQKTSDSVWLFPNEEGQPEGHFLRKFKKVAYRADLNCNRCEPSCKDNPEGCEKHYLHRLRKTRATFWHQNGVSLRTIQYWLSHESLETTMKYLGIEDSAKLQSEINLPMY